MAIAEVSQFIHLSPRIQLISLHEVSLSQFFIFPLVDKNTCGGVESRLSGVLGGRGMYIGAEGLVSL